MNDVTLPAGYRKLNDDELAAMDYKQEIGKHLEEALNNLSDPEFGANLDPRWAAIARTHFQEGLMALGRAITKPDFF